MTKLAPEVAADIESLFGDILTANYMRDSGYNFVRWSDSYYSAIQKLAETHGIELPQLKMAREWFKTERANYVATEKLIGNFSG